MANIKEVCLLFVLGFVVVTTADYVSAYRRFFHPCWRKPCHRYAKCVLTRDHRPVCVCPKACPKKRSPVCGTDWRTYNSYCELAKASCEGKRRTRLRYYGPCVAGSCYRTAYRNLACPYYSRCRLIYGLPCCVCPQETCSFAYKPVCGNDGRTYRNICVLKKNACRRRRLVFIRHPGPCRPNPCHRIHCCCRARCEVNETNHAKCVCNFACTLQYDPVCGSDGKTYGNACSLASAACADQNPRLRPVSKGPCPTTGPPSSSSPPGVTTGKTPITRTASPDPCARVDCCCGARCERNEVNRAKCVCKFACTLQYDPVCGSDGKTYGNACSLASAACADQNPRLRPVSKGPCPTTGPPSSSSPPGVTTSSPITRTVPPTENPCSVMKCGFFARCEVKDGDAVCVCPALCPAVFTPVCGSNGKTYGNVCELQRDSCKLSQLIKVVSDGPCPTAGPPSSSSPSGVINRSMIAPSTQIVRPTVNA